MDKNENGYPGGTVGGVTDNNPSGTGGNNQNRPGNGCGGGCPGFCCGGNNGGNGNNGNNGNNGGVGGVGTNHACGGRGDCLDYMPLAYVYAPDQTFRMLYTAEDALKHGTLFEELYKPMEVYGRE